MEWGAGARNISEAPTLLPGLALAREAFFQVLRLRGPFAVKRRFATVDLCLVFCMLLSSRSRIVAGIMRKMITTRDSETEDMKG